MTLASTSRPGGVAPSFGDVGQEAGRQEDEEGAGEEQQLRPQRHRPQEARAGRPPGPGHGRSLAARSGPVSGENRPCLPVPLPTRGAPGAGAPCQPRRSGAGAPRRVALFAEGERVEHADAIGAGTGGPVGRWPGAARPRRHRGTGAPPSWTGSPVRGVFASTTSSRPSSLRPALNRGYSDIAWPFTAATTVSRSFS